VDPLAALKQHVLEDVLTFVVVNFVDELFLGLVKANQVVLLNLFAVFASAVHFHDGAVLALNGCLGPAFHAQEFHLCLTHCLNFLARLDASDAALNNFSVYSLLLSIGLLWDF